MYPARPPGFTSSRYQKRSTWGGKKVGLTSVLVLDISRLSLAEWCLVLGREGSFEIGGGKKMPTRKSIALHTKNEDDLTLFQQSPGHLVRVSVSALYYYYLVSFSTVFQHSLLILSFVALTLKAFRCFLFWTSIGNNSRAECLSWSVIFDVIPSVSNSFPKQAQVSYVIYFISQSHLISCVSGPLCTSWLTCCVYYDSRPDSPHITIGPSGWHRQTGRQWEGRRLRHGIFDQRLAQSSRKLKQLATQIHRCIIILMAWH